MSPSGGDVEDHKVEKRLFKEELFFLVVGRLNIKWLKE